MAQVGIDEQGSLPELRKDDREVRCEVAAPLAALGADDGQDLPLIGLVEPAQHELAADGAQLLHTRTERLVRGNEFVADGLLVTRRFAQISVGELTR